MNRIFLAFLALFAGLAAEVSPAQARACRETEIGSIVGSTMAARVVAVQAAAAFRPPLRHGAQAVVRPARCADPIVPLLARVRIKADRARE